MYILDTSALINAFSFRHAYTIREVISEIKDMSTKLAVHNFIAAQKLVVLEPKPEEIQKVKEALKKTGDKLSQTDIKLLAVTLEKRAIVVTDDYGIQNVAKTLKLDFFPIDQKGIKKHYAWKHYCPACRKYRTRYFCDTCGKRTVKKVVSRIG